MNLTPEQRQQMIVGRGVLAELRVVALEAALADATERLSESEAKLAELQAQPPAPPRPTNRPAS